jgi:hypothetical protein
MRQHLAIAAVLIGTLPAFSAQAQSKAQPYDQAAAIKATQTECSACHMAYPPSLLPARSWKKIMSTLDNHFGENAQLDAATRAEIETFMVNNAADSHGQVFNQVPPDVTPLRITELPWYKRVHSEVPQYMRTKAGTMSNCLGCHSGGGGGEGGEGGE